MFVKTNKRNVPVVFLSSVLLLIASYGPTLIAAEETLGNKALMTLRGTSHVHTMYSHDSNASLEDVIDGMKRNDFDFVIITDHNSLKGKKRHQAIHLEDESLLLFGIEISTSDGHLIALGVSETPPEDMASQELVDWIHERGGYAILAHPFCPKEPWENWEVKHWDGFEVYNFANELYNRDMIGFGISLYEGEPEGSVLKTVQSLSPESTKLWNESLKSRPVSALVGSDAHLRKNEKYFRVALKSATLCALVPDRSEASLTKAIGQGNSYMVFETRGRADEFSFQAVATSSSYHIGDTVPAGSEVVFHVQSPEEARIRLIDAGKILKEEITRELRYTSSEPGAYRVEVYKENDLWIFTNPIYIAQKIT